MNAMHSVGPRRAALAACATLLALSAGAARAADPTPPEQQVEQLKQGEQHSDKLLADRWHKLVRQRQWVDSTGKHKTFARYLDHDPNLQWVKLLVLVQKGDQQTYKEGQVPLARLSQADQAIVKRIAIVRPQVEQALAASPAGGYPAGEGQLGEQPLGEVAAGGEMRGETPPGEAPAAAPPQPPYTLPAAEPWQTDFATFAANLSVAQGEGGPSLAWGQLHALKNVHDQERMLATIEKLPPEQQPPPPARFQLGFAYGWARSGLGRVMWTATFDGAPGAAAADSPVGLKHDLQLPPPLALVLVPDPIYPGDPARFATGGPVAFVGRFSELGGRGDAPVLKLYIHLPSDEQAPPAAATDNPRFQ